MSNEKPFKQFTWVLIATISQKLTATLDPAEDKGSQAAQNENKSYACKKQQKIITNSTNFKS